MRIGVRSGSGKTAARARPLGLVRASAERWGQVQATCRALRSLVRANAQLDLMPSRGNWKARLDAAADIDDQVEGIAQMIEDAVSQVTCELLESELARRVRKDSARADAK